MRVESSIDHGCSRVCAVAIHPAGMRFAIEQEQPAVAALGFSEALDGGICVSGLTARANQEQRGDGKRRSHDAITFGACASRSKVFCWRYLSAAILMATMRTGMDEETRSKRAGLGRAHGSISVPSAILHYGSAWPRPAISQGVNT